MPIPLRCECGHVWSVADPLAGHIVTCAQCNRARQVPTAVDGSAPGSYPPQAGVYPPQPAGYPMGYGYPVPAQGPGRGMLITGGVLAILAALIWGAVGCAVLFSNEVVPQKFDAMSDRQQIIYVITAIGTFLCAFCVISASFGFAGKLWAAIATTVIQLLLTALTVYAIIDTNGDEAQGAFLFIAVPVVLATIFSGLGIRQANAIEAFRARQPTV